MPIITGLVPQGTTKQQVETLRYLIRLALEEVGVPHNEVTVEPSEALFPEILVFYYDTRNDRLSQTDRPHDHSAEAKVVGEVIVAYFKMGVELLLVEHDPKKSGLFINKNP